MKMLGKTVLLFATVCSIGAHAALPTASEVCGKIAEMPADYVAKAGKIFDSAKGVTASAYPDAEYVELSDITLVEYEADGSCVLWDDEWRKILTMKGQRENSTVSVGVSLRYSLAAIKKVEIVGEDGNVREVDISKTLSLTTDNSSMDANIYDPLDVDITCAVPGLKVGEIVHFITARKVVKPRIRNMWCDCFVFESDNPIKYSALTILAPEKLPLRKIALRNPVGGTVKSHAVRKAGDGRLIYEWEAENVPQMFAEPRMPNILNCVQSLFVSTASDWKEISKWYWTICLPHIAKTTPEMKAKVDDLIKGAKTEEERYRAIFRFVSQEIRYMGLTLEDTAPGYAPHDVDITFNNRYGVCRDKAGLLVSLLRLGGFEAYPVLIHTSLKVDADVPTPYFNHAIACVVLKDKDGNRRYQLMDPTDETTKDLLPSYLAEKTYLVASAEGDPLRISPSPDIEDNMLCVKAKVFVAPDYSATGRYSVDFRGVNDNIFRQFFIEASGEERYNKFRNYVAARSPVFANAKLLSLKVRPDNLQDISKPLSLEAEFAFSGIIDRCGSGSAVLLVPYLSDSVNFANRFLSSSLTLATRRYPIRFFSTLGVRENLEIVNLNAKDGSVSLPGEIDESVGGYSYDRSFAYENGTLNVSRSETLSRLQFTTNEYVEVRNIRKEVERKGREDFKFVPAIPSDVHSITELVKMDVYLLNEFDYAVTNTSVLKVLDYAGMKENSETTKSYNPFKSQYEYVSGVVSNADGNVSEVGAKEFNEMDQEWVATAPRYPHGKIAVANLPNVQSGSVLTEVTALHVTNAFVETALSHVFGAGEYVMKEELTLHVPKGLSPKISEYGNGCKLISNCETNGNEIVYGWRLAEPMISAGEKLTPPVILSKPFVSASFFDRRKVGMRIGKALDRARDAGSDEARALARDMTKDCATPEEKILAIRKFMIKRVRKISIGSLGSQPCDETRLFTAPDVSLRDGYAAPWDWMNAYASMLEAAGFDVEYRYIDNYCELPEAREREIATGGHFDFSIPVIVATYSRGIWPFASKRSWELSLGDNEYSELNAIGSEYRTRYDVGSDAFVKPDIKPGMATVAFEKDVITLRENGAADIDMNVTLYGTDVGPFRKKYEEMTPELKSRHIQALASGVSADAEATGDLVTDTKSYPATSSISFYSEGYAFAKGGNLTLKLDSRANTVLSGNGRRIGDIALSSYACEHDVQEIVFPKGYMSIVSLPKGYGYSIGGDLWKTLKVSTKVKDGHLVVTLAYDILPVRPVLLGREYADLFRAWNCCLSAQRIISVNRN